MRKLHVLMICCFCLLSAMAMAQINEVRGKVTDSIGTPIQGASVTVKGGTTGVSTGADGTFKINVPKTGTIVISSVGVATTEVNVQGREYILVELSRTSQALDEVIVTALGIRRSKNQLPFAAQQINGEEVSQSRTNNFAQNLSGKVSGLEIRQGNTLGASTNIVLRGSKSIAGTNQALFVVDGIPFDNSITNTDGTGRGDANISQVTGRGGYDYGNAVADINPDDIESMTVLKGAAASALYGSRGANGVILITTKKGRRGLGVTINSGVTTASILKSTFAKHQKSYGAGYGLYYEDPSGFFLYRDINGDGTPDLVTPTSEDASYGAAFDANKMVYQWDAFDPTSPFFGKPRPWLPADNDPSTIFDKPTSFNNSIFIDGGSDKGTFKLGYTRSDDKGIMPNSKITKNLINFASSYNLTPALTAGASINFSNIEGKGRYGTGYDDKNLMGNFRQWWQTNVDLKAQRDAYFRTKKNVTWNWADPSDLTPIYWDNPYFTRYENYENDTRNRYFGNVFVSYKITDWLNAMGRISVDSYDEIQEERQAKGSVTTSQYSRFNRTFRETNYDLLLNADKNVSPDINLKGLLGTNIRKNHLESVYASTNGGLIVDRIYSLSNSANPINPPNEFDGRREINGVFAGATFTWKDMITIDGTIRRDASSTLPKGNNVYYYPSVSGGFTFSKLLPNLTWLTYGKLRANYAQVGNDAPYYSTKPTYSIIPPFGTEPVSSVTGTFNNPNLKPERTKSYEVGLEVSLLRSRAGFDITYYQSRTFDQILATTLSTATGYSFKYLNAGTVQNRGIELSAYGTPVKTSNFSWTVNLNWTRNRNKVIELFEGSDNLVLGSFQGGVTINATLGQPYQTIRGRNFVYYSATPDPVTGLNEKSYGSPSERIVMANGRYKLSTVSNEVIGNANPDWIGGISNTLRYKNVSLSWLIDVRQGGDVFSLDLYYGLATGLYPETAGNNDLGNPLRSSLANGGGIIREGVTADGKPNSNRVSAEYFGAYGYRYSPAASFVYDASYVKLREAALTYSIPQKSLAKLHPFKGIDFSLIGRNLWIIHKNLPYSDPEENISAGNLQGYQGGAYPTTRTFTFNVKLRF